MAEVNREFIAPMLPSGLVFGQPGVYRHSGLPWWLNYYRRILRAPSAERS
jgi:hypothetical protein